MFSLQRLMGEDHKFLELLEASANEASQSVGALKALLGKQSHKPTLKTFAALRSKEKDITSQIAELVIRAMVVAMEREDIEALSSALYRIPKTVEKFAECLGGKVAVGAVRASVGTATNEADIARLIGVVTECAGTMRKGSDS